MSYFNFSATKFKRNFASFDETYYYIQLKPQGDATTVIEEIKPFKGRAGRDFFYSLEYFPRCILCKVDKGVAEIILFGSYYSAKIRFNLAEILQKRFKKHTAERKPFLMPPRDLIEKGFAEIQGTLASSSSGQESV